MRLSERPERNSVGSCTWGKRHADGYWKQNTPRYDIEQLTFCQPHEPSNELFNKNAGQDNMKINIYLPCRHVYLKSTCPYLFNAFISIFYMPIGHASVKSTCPPQNSTCPRCSRSHLFAPCIALSDAGASHNVYSRELCFVIWHYLGHCISGVKITFTCIWSGCYTLRWSISAECSWM